MYSLFKKIGIALFIAGALLAPVQFDFSPNVASADFTEVSRTEKSIGSSGTWTDIDVSAIVPAGATGVFGEWISNSGPRNIGARKNGSTDNRTNNICDNCHANFAVGVDSSRIFEGYCSDAAQCRWYIKGYWTTDATFDTNGTDQSTGTTGSWVDIDLATECSGTGTGAVLETINGGGDNNFGLRSNGSTDNRTNLLQSDYAHQFDIVDLDASEILEQQIGSTNVDVFYIGCFTAGYTGLTNGTDKSLGSTGSYVDLTASPAGAIGSVIEVISDAQRNFYIRKNGSSDSNVKVINRHSWWITALDGSQLAEGQIDNTGVDFFETGYFVATAAPAAGPPKVPDIISSD